MDMLASSSVVPSDGAPMTAAPVDAQSPMLKRKRSPSISNPTSATSNPPHPAKATKTSGANQLSINYLVRQSDEDLPLINKDDTLPNLLALLASYSNILDRHESIASNLGAKPLGPILIKRFERCFDRPPKVVASHHKGAATAPDDSTHSISWYEVIEFARSHPAQFTLDTFSQGSRVCQFYYPQKQLRVQVSEEDWLFINSGRCQELIPPLPIWEDEEKEVGTCDVLEAKLKELTNVADMVAARTRQLGHRLKGRRAAIIERRAEGGSGTPAKANALQTTTAPPGSTPAPGSFTAVNSGAQNGKASTENGEPNLGSSMAVRNDLLRHFESLPHNQALSQPRPQHRQSLAASTHQAPSHSTNMPDATNQPTSPIYRAASTTSSLSPVPASLYPDPSHQASARPPSSGVSYQHSHSHNPSKHNFSRPLPPALESSQPFRPLCQAHMDALPRGHRVLPPCDRCRRLRMDCVKNLTSCAGCTKKHARCHWRDVERGEVLALEAEGGYSGDAYMESGYGGGEYGGGYSDMGAGGYMDGFQEAAYGVDDVSEEDDDDSNPLEDLEALGEQEEQERADEEGLAGAKELARKGWEAGLKSVENGENDDGANGGGEEVVMSNGDVGASDANREPGAELNVSAPSPKTTQHIPPTDLAATTVQADGAVNQDAPTGFLTSHSENPVGTDTATKIATDSRHPDDVSLVDSGHKNSADEAAAPSFPHVATQQEQKLPDFPVPSGGFHAVNAPNIGDGIAGAGFNGVTERS